MQVQSFALRLALVITAAALATLAAPRTLRAQPFELINFEGAGHAGARVCYFADGTPLYRASGLASVRILRPEVSMLAGHGGSGGTMATTPGFRLRPDQSAQVYADYIARVQASGQRIGVNLACESGVPSGPFALDKPPNMPCMAERCARGIASPGSGPALANTQIGFTGKLSGARVGGGLVLCQTEPLLNNPYGVIAYHGYPVRAGATNATSLEACVEARYISDGRPLMEQLCQSGRSCTMVAEPPPGAQEMGALGRRPSALGTAGRVCGNVVFIAGTEVLMYQAEEFARYADELDAASLRGDGIPFNDDAVMPWCGDYWQQFGWYYGICDDPPADPSWAGTPRLPRPGSPHYDEVFGARLRESFGPNSHVYRCWKRGLDPVPAGHLEVPVLRLVHQRRNFEDMLRSRGPDCFRPYNEVLVPDVERIPYYFPRGYRARNPGADCPGVRGGRIQAPGGVDPPYQGGCQVAGGAGLILVLAGLMVRRRRRGSR